MKTLTCLLVISVLAALPATAGVGVSVHAGGGFRGTGFHGGYGGGHSFCGPRGYPFFGGSYGYASYYGYAPYSIGYGSDSYDSSASFYASPETAPIDTTTSPSQAVNPAAAPAGPLPAGKVDEFGFVHSPYSTTTFKAANVANGQVFYDPTTGQPFMIHVSPPSPAPAATVAPSANWLPTGKLDEFGYVHSPFSTFTIKLHNGDTAKTFRDPFTGKDFSVSMPAPATIAATNVSK